MHILCDSCLLGTYSLNIIWLYCQLIMDMTDICLFFFLVRLMQVK